MKLSKDNSTSETFEFNGVKNILIVGGVGTVVLERSVSGSEFYPLSTNLSGGVARFECVGMCAYNGTLEEKGEGAKYRFRGEIESGEVEITVSRGG